MEESMMDGLKHLVFLKFNEGTSQADVAKIVTAFIKLKDKIPQIQSIDWGTDVSVEKKNQGFTHCFCLSFSDSSGRDAYLPHPSHSEFSAMIKPFVEKVFVFDYVVNS